MTELRFSVPGMTCSHCVAAVDEELRKVDGVIAIAIDLESKVVVVEGDDIRMDDVTAAVDQAGYEVAEV